MRLGVAKIGQHAIAQVLGDEPFGLGDHLGAAAVIDANDLAQVLRIQPRRKGCRADEVAEHDRELPTLGGFLAQPSAASRGLKGTNSVGGIRLDRAQHLATAPSTTPNFSRS